MYRFKKKLPALVTIILLLMAASGESYQSPSQNQPAATTSKTQSGAASDASGKPVKRRFIRDHWTSNLEGLPQNSVVDLARSTDGYLWVGTQEGVTRFDGVKFKNYKDSQGWANKDIFTNVILAASDNSLWVGTRAGLNQIKNDVFTTYTTQSGLPYDYVTALAEDRSGTIWIGTRKGVARLSNGQFTTFSINDGLIDNDVMAITVTRDGSVWVGAEKGLTRIKDGKFYNFTEREGLTSNKITRIYEARNGTLWIGTEGGGLNKYKDGKFSALTTKDGLSNKSVFSIAEDREGWLWIGTGTGLDYMEGGEDGWVINYTKTDKAFNDQIHCIYPDNEGNIWVGTKSNALFKLRKSKFTVYGEPEGLPKDDVWCALESRDGSLWLGLGAGGGLARMKGGKIQSWSIQHGLPDSEVLSLYEARDGSLWLGTGGGLCRFTNGRFNCYSTSQGLANDQVTAIAETADGSLWIGTYDGVSQFKDGKIINLWNQKGLDNNLIGDAMVAKDDSVWFVGMPDGLFQIKDGQVKNFSTAQGLSSDQTTSVYEDAAGDLWVGTYQSGLNRIRPNGAVTSYSTKQGLLEDQVFDTIEDGIGNFWLTSNHGLFRISKQQFDDLDQGKIKSLSPLRYGIADGMRTEECNGGSQPSGWKTRDGRILITTIKGLVTFNPRQVSDETFLPQVAIEQIIADRAPVKFIDRIEVGPGLHDLEIQYTGLSMLAPEKIQFKYLLEGLFDNTWVEAGTRRAAYYTNLPPGDYRFHVIASNADGRWNEPGKVIQIRVKKYFYQQFWFYLLCAISLVLGGYAAQRIWVHRSNEKLLSKITMSLPIAMCVIDSKSSVKMLNNQFVKDLGYTMNDLSNLNEWFEKVYPDSDLRTDAVSSWEKVITANSRSDLRLIPREWHIRCKDGTERDVEVRIAMALDRIIVTFNDITYRTRAEQALKASHQQLRELAARLQQAREEERAFIAREIHDELGQLLTGLKFDLKWLEKRLPANSQDGDLLRKKMVSVLDLVDETIRALRRIATEFRPGVLDTLGLIAAIEWQAQEFSNRTGIECDFSEQLPHQLKDQECETALFRIFQEALTNVARHSNATEVKVSLSRQNGALVLQIQDNGRGITEKELNNPHSIGLLGMRERAHVFGGEVKVSGAPGLGTTVTARIPLESLSENGNRKALSGSRTP